MLEGKAANRCCFILTSDIRYLASALLFPAFRIKSKILSGDLSLADVLCGVIPVKSRASVRSRFPSLSRHRFCRKTLVACVHCGLEIRLKRTIVEHDDLTGRSSTRKACVNDFRHDRRLILTPGNHRFGVTPLEISSSKTLLESKTTNSAPGLSTGTRLQLSAIAL